MKNLTQILKQEDLIGKTISNVHDTDDKIFLMFSDNSFCIIKNSWNSEGYPEIEDDKINLEPDDFNIDVLETIGVISKQDKEKYIQESKERRQEYIKKQELITLESLKKKYEQ